MRRPRALGATLLTLLLVPLAPTAAAAPTPWPWAEFTLTPDAGATTATTFALSLVGAHVPHGTWVVLDWSDGTVLQGEAIHGGINWEGDPPDPLQHRYAAPGPKRVTLSLDLAGKTSLAAAWVSVGRLTDVEATRAQEALVRGSSGPPVDVVDVRNAPSADVADRRIVSIVNALEGGVVAGLLGGIGRFAYETCDADGCAPGALDGARDPEGVSTSAFSALLQKALAADHLALAIGDDAGNVDDAALLAALERARLADADVVVVLASPRLAPDEQSVGSSLPLNVSTTLREPRDAEHDTIALWRAALRNTVGIDLGREAPHDAGHYDARCPPHHAQGPGPGERSTPGLARAWTWERAVKPLDRLAPADRAHLGPTDETALRREAGPLLLHACVLQAARDLAASGALVVVPAGDAARHVGVAGASPSWDAQSLAPLAELPEVLTVGATTSVSVGVPGPPAYGARRVVLETSGAGPTRAFYGVKPDLLAPGDVPVLVAPGSAPAGSPPALTHHRDVFARNNGWTLLSGASIQGGELHAGTAHLTRAVPTAADPGYDLTITHPIPGAQPASHVFVLAQSLIAGAPRGGPGFELKVTRITSALASVELIPFTPSIANGQRMACGLPPQSPCPLAFPSTGKLRVVAEPIDGGYRWKVYDLGADAVERTTATLKISGAQSCECRTFWIQGNVRVDDLVVRGWPGVAEPLLDEAAATPLAGPHGEARVRPSTRVAAAYVAGYAALAQARETEERGFWNVTNVRARLASESRPLADVPGLVQGAGELSVEDALVLDPIARPGRSVSLDVGVDWGLVDAPASRSVTFRALDRWYPNGHAPRGVYESAQWWRFEADGSVVVPATAPTLHESHEGPVKEGPTREITLHLDTLPAEPGVYVGRIPFRVAGYPSAAATDPAIDAVFRWANLTVVATRGVDVSVDASASGLAPGEIAWLFPAREPTGLVHELFPGAPVARVAVDAASRILAGTLPAAEYAIATASDSRLPIPRAGLPPHEGAPSRTLTLLQGSLLLDGSPRALPPAVARAPVAFRMLDIVQGAEFVATTVEPAWTTHQALADPRAVALAVWDERGGSGADALDEPFPIGETTMAWDHRVVATLPAAAVDAATPAAAEAAIRAHVAARRLDPNALDGAIDTRPFLAEGELRLPWSKLRASVALPRPLRDAHGIVALPLELREASAVVRVGVGDQWEVFLVTTEGAAVPDPPGGFAWGHDADPLDAFDDGTGGGVLSGHGHAHAGQGPGRLVFRPPGPAGHLLPFGLHDLTDDDATLLLEILVIPAPPAATALGTRLGDPVPGPRFRLSPVGVYAWTSGEAPRGSATLGPLVAPARPGTADEATAIAAPTPGAARLPELLEAYVRGPAAGLVLDAVGAPGTIPAGEGARWMPAPGDGTTLVDPWGMSATIAGAPHEGGAAHVYGTRPHLHPFQPEHVSFHEADGAIWRIDGALLRAASGPAGALLRFAGEPPASGGFATAEPFPDAPDPARGGYPRTDLCLSPSGLILAGWGLPRLCPGVPPDPADELLGIGLDPASGLAHTIATLVDGETLRSLLAPIAAEILPGGTGGAGAAPPAYRGVVPRPGALLLLDHALTPEGAGEARGRVRLRVEEGPWQTLATIEGHDVLVPPVAPRARTLDVFDLDAYAGLRVEILLETENTSAEYGALVAARSVPLPAPRGPAPAFAAPPSAGTQAPAPRFGPREGAAAAAAPEARIALPAGLFVEGALTIAGKELALGGTGAHGTDGIVRVRPGAHLTIEDARLAPLAPGARWGIVVEAGATLTLARTVLVEGGAPATRGATLLVAGGEARLADAVLAGGDHGLAIAGGDAILARTTIAGFARAADVTDASLRSTDALVLANARGIVARNATVDVLRGVYAATRASALVVQDSLVAIDGATFYGNGGGGADAAVVASGGLGTGAVGLHGTTFHANARALHALADVDAHAIGVRQSASDALTVGPGARLRLAASDVVSAGAALRAGAGSVVEIHGSALAGEPWLECADLAPPAALALVASERQGGYDTTCGPEPASAARAAPDPAWRHPLARPFAGAGPQRLLALPREAATTLFERGPDGTLVALALAEDAYDPRDPDRALQLVAGDASGALAGAAWTVDVTRDTVPPAPDVEIDAPDTDAWFGATSLPLRIRATDAGSGVATRGLQLSSRDALGRTGVTGLPVLADARAEVATAGVGGSAGLLLASGERASLTPTARDRAGNVGVGAARSLNLDLTPPATWIHAARPCGKLLAHDVSWRARDPRAGSGLAPPDATTYSLSALVLDLGYILNATGLDQVDWRALASPDTAAGEARLAADRAAARAALAATGATEIDEEARALLEGRDPQRLAAFLLRQLDARDDALAHATDPDRLPLVAWRPLGDFTRDVEGIRYDPLADLDAFLLANPLLGDHGAAAWTGHRALASEIDALAAAQLVALAPFELAGYAGNATPVNATLLADQLAWLADGIGELLPIALLYRIEARDAVGNVARAYTPALSDAYAPRAILRLLDSETQHALAGALLRAEARVDLTDLHASLRIFDPDCGLEALQILQDAVNATGAPPDHAHGAITVYPRDGQIELTPRALADLLPAGTCGPVQLALVATDKAGRSTGLEVHTLVDRIAPETIVERFGRETGPAGPAPLVPAGAREAFAPPAASAEWIGAERLRIDALSVSRNAPGCEEASAAIHDIVVEARAPGGPWSVLHRAHAGHTSRAPLNASVEIAGRNLTIAEPRLDGAPVEIRVRARDEAGNVETDAPVATVRVDRIAPECSLTPFGASAGYEIPYELSASDPNAGIPGEVASVALLVRPRPPAAGHEHLVAALPTEGGAGVATLDRHRLPGWIDGRGLNDVTYACVVYDRARNGRVGEPFDAVLDLIGPDVWLLDPPTHANGTTTLRWSVDAGMQTLRNVTIVASRLGEGVPDEEIHLDASAGVYTLDPGPVETIDGDAWQVLVEAFSTRNTVGNTSHVVRFDVVAPEASFGTLAQSLRAGGFLPPGRFAMDLADPGVRPSPVASWIDAVGADGSTARLAPGSDGLFEATLVDGSWTLVAHAQDAAGNRAAPSEPLVVLLDRTPPATSLVDTTGVLASGIADEIEGAWISPATTFRLQVLDPTVGGVASGPATLRVDAVALDPADLAPTGVRVALDVLPTGNFFEARLPTGALGGALPSGSIFRLEVLATDGAGNAEASAPLALPGALFAWDATPPSVTLDAIPAHVSTTTLAIGATASDGPALVRSGLAERRLVALRDGLRGEHAWSPWTAGSPLVLDLTADEGRRVGVCIEARDRAGNIGGCESPVVVLVDRTAPLVTILPPADASLVDPTTRLAPIEIGVLVENRVHAPGHDAAPVEAILLDVTSRDAKLPGTARIPLGALAAIPPGGSVVVPVMLDAPDGAGLALRAGALDAAGNRATLGAADGATPRRTTEDLFLPFDDGAADRSGHGRPLHVQGRETPGAHGGGWRLEGYEAIQHLPPGGIAGQGDVTAMAWIRTETAPGGPRPVLGYVESQTAPYPWSIVLTPDGRPEAGVATTTGTTTIRAPAPLAPGRWTHVALVFDEPHLRLLVDGAIVAEATRSGTIAAGRPLQIGGGPTGTAAIEIDEVRVLNAALAADAIADLATRPYLGAGEPELRLHLDLTPPRSVAFPQDPLEAPRIGSDEIRIHAEDPANGSGVATLRLEARIGGPEGYAEGIVQDDGAATLLAQPPLGRNQPAGTLARPIAIPQGVSGARVEIRAKTTLAGGTTNCAVADSLFLQANLGPHTLPDVDATTLASPAWIASPVLAVAPGGTTLAIGLGTRSSSWQTCAGTATLEIDEIRVRDAATQAMLYRETFPAGLALAEGWSATGTAAAPARRLPDLASTARPNVAHSSLWTGTSGLLWTPAGPTDPRTTATVVGAAQLLTGASHALQMRYEHQAGTVTTNPVPVERIGTTFGGGGLAADVLTLEAEVSETTSPAATLTERVAIEVGLSGGGTILFLLREETSAGRDPTACYGGATGTPPGWRAYRFDVAAEKARCGLVGDVTRLGLHFEKTSAVASGSAILSARIADVRLLRHAELVVDLPWSFPYYGETHTRLQVSADGAIRLGPEAGGPPTRTIAPLWAPGLTDRGAVGATLRGVDAQVGADRVSLVWNVLDLTATPPAAHVFAATLRATGEVSFDHALVPTPPAGGRVGVYGPAGAAALEIARAPATGTHVDLVPGTGAWVPVGDVQGLRASGLPTGRLLHLRSVAVDAAGNVEIQTGERADAVVLLSLP